MKNPYNQGEPVCGDKFYGREQLIEDIRNGKSGRVSIIGARGMGKTSLLREIEHRLNLTNNIGVYFSLEGVDEENFKDRFEYVSKMKSESFKKGGIKIEKVFRKAKNLFDVLSTIDEELRKRDVRLFLLFDSAEDLVNLDSGFLRGLRGFFEMAVNIRCILAISSAIRRLEEKSADWPNSPFLYGSERHLIKSLDDMDAEALIRQGNKVDVLTNIDEIQEKTGNQPYLIQLLCHELFDEERNCLTEVLPENLDVVSTVASSIMEDSYNLLLPLQQEIIRLVSKVEPINIDDLGKQFTYLPESSLRRNVYELADFGYLKKSEERYSVSNYFLKEWLVENQDSLIQPAAQPAAAKTEELLKGLKEIRDFIHPPVLDNYQGFVTAQWTNLNGEKLPSSERADAFASMEGTVQLIVTFQADEPKSGNYKLIDIFEGNDAEKVTFVVNIVSASLRIIDKSRIALTVRTTEGALAEQKFHFTTEHEGIHYVYVEVYQKKQPIQVVRTTLEVLQS